MHAFAGSLPKELCKLVNLEHLIVSSNSLSGPLVVPDNENENVSSAYFADIFILFQENYPRSSETSSI